MLRSFVGPFIATFFISMFVLIMQAAWLYIDDLVGKGLGMSVILQFFYYTTLTLVPMGMPLAVLLASIMTFGGLGENYELTAMKAAGISLLRIMKPLIFLIIVLTISAFYFSNNVLPYANLKAKTLMLDIRKHSPELALKEGVFINDIDNYSILVEKIDKKTGMMYGMMIYNHTGIDRNYEVTIADSGVMEANADATIMQVELYNGYTYTEEAIKDPKKSTTFPARTVKFDKQYFKIQMGGNEFERSDEDTYKDHYSMLNIKQLNKNIDSLTQKINVEKMQKSDDLVSHRYLRNRNREAKQDSVLLAETQGKVLDIDSLYLAMDIREQVEVLKRAVGYANEVKMGQDPQLKYDEDALRRHDIEWHRKFTLSFACFIFFFIGAPLGAIIRKGGLGMPVIVSIFLFIIYYVIWMMGERAAREGSLEPWQGMWLSSVILLPLGVFLTSTAINDSAVLNADSYRMFVKRITDFFEKIFQKKKQHA